MARGTELILVCLSLLLFPSDLQAEFTLGTMEWKFDACQHGCECFDLNMANVTATENVGFVQQATGTTSGHSQYNQSRYAVHCNESELNWFYRMEVDFMNLVRGIPSNTTDLVVQSFFSPIELGVIALKPLFYPMLLTITVDGCAQLTIQANSFQSKLFTSVEQITITNNLMKSNEIQRGTFYILPYVKNITIVKNIFLSIVQSESFQAMPQVEIINMTRNGLNYIQPGFIGNVPALTTLDLSDNFLSNLPGDDILSLSSSSLKHLFMTGNRWNCSQCGMSWILVLNKSVLADHIPAVCLYPKHLNGTALNQLTTEHFKHCGQFFTSYQYFYSVVTYMILFLFCLSVPLFTTTLKFIASRRVIKIGQLSYYPMCPLGAFVFKGFLNDGRPAAVKIVPKLPSKRPKELKVLLNMSQRNPPHHENVIQYLMMQDDYQFTYIALELCQGNLQDLVTKATDNKAVLCQLTSTECLYPLASGLKYIHDVCEVQHRDIKPSNILWKAGQFGKLRFILSDFDLSHFAEKTSSHKIKRGTEGWSAPELWRAESRSYHVDIFSLGCVFYYVLTQGCHPFGSLADLTQKQVQENILNHQFSLEISSVHCCTQSKANAAKMLIEHMIQADANSRPTAHDICDHPLFWSLERQARFYHNIGKHMKNREELQNVMSRLEMGKDKVFRGSWLEGLHPRVKSDAKGFKPRQEELCALLQVIGNKVKHIHECGTEVKAVYGGHEEGVARYYNEEFPMLLAYVYSVWQEFN